MNAELVSLAFSRHQLNKSMTLEQALSLLWEQDLINVGELAEKAISRKSGLRQRAKGHKGSDFEDRSDSKFVTVSYWRTSAYAVISSFHNKVGTLRVCVHEPKTDLNYYFLIPPRIYRNYKNVGNSIKIWFHQDGSPHSPRRAGYRHDLWEYQVAAKQWAGRLKKTS